MKKKINFGMIDCHGLSMKPLYTIPSNMYVVMVCDYISKNVDFIRSRKVKLPNEITDGENTATTIKELTAKVFKSLNFKYSVNHIDDYIKDTTIKSLSETLCIFPPGYDIHELYLYGEEPLGHESRKSFFSNLPLPILNKKLDYDRTIELPNTTLSIVLGDSKYGIKDKLQEEIYVLIVLACRTNYSNIPLIHSEFPQSFNDYNTKSVNGAYNTLIKTVERIFKTNNLLKQYDMLSLISWIIKSADETSAHVNAVKMSSILPDETVLTNSLMDSCFDKEILNNYRKLTTGRAGYRLLQYCSKIYLSRNIITSYEIEKELLDKYKKVLLNPLDKKVLSIYNNYKWTISDVYNGYQFIIDILPAHIQIGEIDNKVQELLELLSKILETDIETSSVKLFQYLITYKKKYGHVITNKSILIDSTLLMGKILGIYKKYIMMVVTEAIYSKDNKIISYLQKQLDIVNNNKVIKTILNLNKSLLEDVKNSIKLMEIYTDMFKKCVGGKFNEKFLKYKKVYSKIKQPIIPWFPDPIHYEQELKRTETNTGIMKVCN